VHIISWNPGEDGDPTANGGAGEGDYVYGTHHVITGSGNDVIKTTFTCDDAPGDAHTYETNEGNDTIRLGSCNADVDGGTGDDTVGYEPSSDSVEIDLSTDSVTIGTHTQTLSAVENAEGSPQNDVIRGSSSGESLAGGAGDDFLQGKGGDDAETGGDGDDTFDEGSQKNGADTLDGGDGDHDNVDYHLRSSLPTLSNDGIANDGEAGEQDNVVNVETADMPVIQFVRPDALIKWQKDRNYQGGDVYSAKARKETRLVKAKRGSKQTFLLQFQNDGNVLDTMRLKGTKPVAGFAAKFVLGKKDVTKQVLAGTFRLLNLSAGDSRSLKLIVTVKASAKPKASAGILVTASSEADSGVKDAVKAVVKVTAG
jgi:hypothetical protein